MARYPSQPFLPTVISQPSYAVRVIPPILQMRTLRFTEGKRFAQSSAVRKQFSATLGNKTFPMLCFFLKERMFSFWCVNRRRAPREGHCKYHHFSSGALSTYITLFINIPQGVDPRICPQVGHQKDVCLWGRGWDGGSGPCHSAGPGGWGWRTGRWPQAALAET